MSEKGVTVAASGGVEHLLLGSSWHTSCYYGLHEDAKILGVLMWVSWVVIRATAH